MRVVINTCVWVAAVRSRRGASFALLQEIPHHRFRFGISVPLFLEYKEQLLRSAKTKATSLTTIQVDQILAALAHYGSEVPIYYRLRPNLADENDNLVFECAANFGATIIITHNVRDFVRPELKGYAFEILKPCEFLLSLKEAES